MICFLNSNSLKSIESHSSDQRLSSMTSMRGVGTVCLIAQSCQTLPHHGLYSLLGSSVHGILQARSLEWVVISFSRGSSQPRDQTQVSCIAESSGKPWSRHRLEYRGSSRWSRSLQWSVNQVTNLRVHAPFQSLHRSAPVIDYRAVHSFIKHWVSPYQALYYWGWV